MKFNERYNKLLSEAVGLHAESAKLSNKYREYLKGFPKKDVANFGREIIKDVIKRKSFKDTYELDTDDELLKDYKLKISSIESNRASYVNDARRNFISIKVHKADDEDDRKREWKDLEDEFLDTLMHEVGHYYVQAKEDRLKSGAGYEGDLMKTYYTNPEEVSLHAYNIWRQIKKQLARTGKTIEDISPEGLLRMIKSKVKDLPRTTRIPANFPVKTQKLYINYIKKIIADKLGKDFWKGVK